MTEIARVSRDQTITASEVRASFDSTRGREHFCMEWFGRPLSNYCTPVFYNLGWSANDVTLLRSCIAFGAVVVLGCGIDEIVALAAVAYYVSVVLDCVDGNLARVCNSASYWGKFIDGLSDNILYLLAPLSAGVGLWMNNNDGVAVLAGAVTTLVACLAELIRNRLSFFRDWMVSETGPLTSHDVGARTTPQRIEQAMASILVNSLFFAPLLLLVPNGLRLYLTALLVIQAPASAIWMIAILVHGRAILKRGRVSIHAAVNRQDRPTTV